MSKVRLTATIACFQIRKKWSKKPLVYRVYLNLQLRFFTQFREKLFSMQTTKAQISQLRHACADPDNSNGGGGGGGGGQIASRGRFVPVFLLGNKRQLMIFMGRSGPPAPSVSASDPINILGPRSPPISELQTVWIHILFYFFCWAWSIHKTSANYVSWRQGQRQHDPF